MKIHISNLADRIWRKVGKREEMRGECVFPLQPRSSRHVPLRGASASILLPLRLRHTSPSGSAASTAYQPYTGCCESGVLRFSRTLGSLVSPPFCSRTLVSRAPVLVKSVRVSRFGHHPDLPAPAFQPSRVFASFFHPFSRPSPIKSFLIVIFLIVVYSCKKKKKRKESSLLVSLWRIQDYWSGISSRKSKQHGDSHVRGVFRG